MRSPGHRILLCLAGWLLAGGALGAPTSIEEQSRALERASNAVIGLRMRAVDDARSATTLGTVREGSGVVIADELVLTIGYLVLEAERVELATGDGRDIPARVVGYDVATGFGLVQPLVPLRLPPVPLGEAAVLRSGEPLLSVSGGADGTIGPVRLVSQRPFSGYWEYHIDGALFTAPARSDHSGAGLFNLQGELVGIGSLRVTDAAGADAGALAGNMFVPIDLLKPILDEMRRNGRSQASARAWIGITCVEADGAIVVVRVADDSPADVAGLQAGDLILRIDGVAVERLDQLWKRLWAGASPEREVTLVIRREGEVQTMKVQAVDRAKTLRRAQGV